MTLIIDILIARISFDISGNIIRNKESISTNLKLNQQAITSTENEIIRKTFIYAGTLLASKSSDNENLDYYIQDHLG